MSTPIYLTCDTPEEVPTVEQILSRVSREQGLVLQLPSQHGHASPWPETAALVRTLAQALPENYAVFEPWRTVEGVNRIAIRQLISRPEVLAHAAEVLEAAREFRHLARSLIVRLAEKLGVPLEAFWTRLVRCEVPEWGDLDPEWRYYFHGLECAFSNHRTGQYLDVVLGYPDEFGVLDAAFFAGFIKSTPGYQSLASLLRDDFHDTARIMAVLEEEGWLQRVDRRFPLAQSGLVAPDPEP